MRAVLDGLRNEGLIDNFEITDDDGRMILTIDTRQGRGVASRLKKALAARPSDERQPIVVMINCADNTRKRRPLSRIDEDVEPS